MTLTFHVRTRMRHLWAEVGSCCVIAQDMVKTCRKVKRQIKRRQEKILLHAPQASHDLPC
jgi:hypothetical protein